MRLSQMGLGLTRRGGGSPYAAGGLTPTVIADFTNEVYRDNAGNTAFADMFTYSGASLKTMVDSDGLLKWSPHNNLVVSEQFATYAPAATNVTIADNGGSVNGIQLSTLTDDATSGEHKIAITHGGVTGATYDVRVYVKAGTLTTFSMYGSGGLNFGATVVVNLSTGSITSGPGTISEVATGIYLLTVPATCSFTGANALNLRMGSGSYSGSGDTLLLGGAHSVRTDLGGTVNAYGRSDKYVQTTGSASYLPRRNNYRWNGSAWVKAGLRFETEARTNLLPYSNDFTAGSWSVGVGVSATITPSSSTGVDGNLSASLFAASSTTTSVMQLFYDGGVTVSASQVYAHSIFVEKQNLRYIQLRAFNSSGNYAAAVFDLDNSGAVTDSTAAGTYTFVDAYAEDVGGGIYRLTLLSSTTGTNTWFVIDGTDTGTPSRNAAGGISYSRTEGDGYYIHFAQQEAGTTVSSYIPASGSTVTRSAETLSIAAAKMAYNSAMMCYQMSGKQSYADDGTNASFFLHGANVSNGVSASIYTNGGRVGLLALEVYNTLVQAAVLSAENYFTPGVDVDFNIAIRAGTNTFRLCESGTLIGSEDTSGTLPAAGDMQIGVSRFSASPSFMGTIEQLLQWDEELNDAALQEATT